MSKIKLSESELQQILVETVTRLLEDYADNADQDNAQEQPLIVDNFDLVAKHMNFNSDDDVYFAQILQRKKDNPDLPIKHGRFFLKSFWIKSVDELMSYKNEIMNICQNNNARAYIYMNPRSAKECNDYAENVLKRRFAQRGKGYGRFRGHELEYAYGVKKDWDTRPISLIDIDTKDEQVFQKVKDILKIYGIDIFFEYRTPSGGLHLFLNDKKAQKLDFSMFDDWKNKGMWSTVHFSADSPALLYSAVKPSGAY